MDDSQFCGIRRLSGRQTPHWSTICSLRHNGFKWQEIYSRRSIFPIKNLTSHYLKERKIPFAKLRSVYAITSGRKVKVMRDYGCFCDNEPHRMQRKASLSLHGRALEESCRPAIEAKTSASSWVFVFVTRSLENFRGDLSVTAQHSLRQPTPFISFFIQFPLVSVELPAHHDLLQIRLPKSTNSG